MSDRLAIYDQNNFYSVILNFLSFNSSSPLNNTLNFTYGVLGLGFLPKSQYANRTSYMARLLNYTIIDSFIFSLNLTDRSNASLYLGGYYIDYSKKDSFIAPINAINQTYNNWTAYVDKIQYISEKSSLSVLSTQT
jgi:hypothetical protein